MIEQYFIKQAKSPARDNLSAESQRRKSRVEVNSDYDCKKRKREFQPQWLIDFKWLRQELDTENTLEGEAKGYCFICREFPDYADKQSGLFEGMILKRRDRGSYMSAHVLLNLLNELGKRDKMRGLPSILSLFRNEFNKFNNTRARMLDSIYHMIKSHFC